MYLDVLADHSVALLAAVRAAGPSAPVPGCPGWTGADLAWHIGEVQDFWGWVVRERSMAPAEYEDPSRPESADAEQAFTDILTFASAAAAELHRVLTEADPDTPIWNWTGRDQTASWVVRRMAQEVAVHRFDAERTAGRDHRLDADLAADGIDEFLTFFQPSSDVEPLTGSVHLHVTDADGEWTVLTDDDGAATVTREHTKADAALRGPAHDLLMTLWRRMPVDMVDVFGDRALAETFVARPGAA
ncbi:maleylpyruvate isomerase family mycothiol-dependent enzyme [soil metagenome]